jgi:hypothetical protein
MDKNVNLTEGFKERGIGVQCAYILDCIKDSSYVHDEEIEIGSDKEAVALVVNKFMETANYEDNKKRFPNLQDRIEDWLRGLPPVCSLEYKYYNIEQIGISWGYCGTEKRAAEFVEKWWSVLAFRIIQLADIFEISLM